ncbi:MAG: hypothetical protein GC151_01755 [Betaproteobacteria bacterium]|nr:hypothetical protein [Betaproteobacteria bacterium]
MSGQRGNPFVAIAGVTGGISLAIVVIVAVLARDYLPVVPWIIGALVVLGIALGYFASRNSG